MSLRVLHIFVISKTTCFYHIWKHLHRNHLNFFRMSLLWINVKMISVSGIALKFQNFGMKTTPGQTFLYIASSLNPIWTLEGMIKLGGNQKMHGKAGSMIPFLRKILGKTGNPWDKGRRTKKYDDIKSFLEVKITRYDSSKQERKSHRCLLSTLQLLRKERHHEEMETYISQVGIHAYQS